MQAITERSGRLPSARTAVCVPLRNEEELLPALLAGLEAQISPPEDVGLFFFLDSCHDGTERLLLEHAAVSRWRLRHDTGSTNSSPNAGSARARAMDMGLNFLAGRGGHLLTTDADSIPAPNWLLEMQTALEQADVVAGRIVRLQQCPSPAQDRTEAYYDRLFAFRRRLDPVSWESERPHHFTGGANLGFRAAAYLAAGGFQPRASGEDAQIVDDAARAGLKVRRHSASLVYTSDRRRGRAIGGLAEALCLLDSKDLSASSVAHPVDAAWQYSGHAAARRAFASGDMDLLASQLALNADHLSGVARQSPNAEAFAMRAVPEPPGGMRHISFVAAEAILEELLERAELVAAIVDRARQ